MQKRLIQKLPILNNTVNTLKVELYYNKGGMNYFTSNSEPRGLYLSVSPVTVHEGSVTFTAFSGIKKCVKQMERFNQKQFDNFVVDETEMENLINYVIRKNNLEVERESK